MVDEEVVVLEDQAEEVVVLEHQAKEQVEDLPEEERGLLLNSGEE